MEEMSNSQSSQYKLLDGNIVDAVSRIPRLSFSIFGIDIYYFFKAIISQQTDFWLVWSICKL